MNEANSWIKPPEPFSFEPEKWEIWRSRFLRYMNLSGRSGNSDKEKIDLLIYSMGQQAEVIYKQFLERQRTFDLVLSRFDQYFNPKKQLGCLRATFHNRKQHKGELVENFIIDLQNIANGCEYGTMRDEMVRDKIIAGIRDVQLSRQLQLEDNLTLEETIRIVKQMEEQKKRKGVISSEIRNVKREPEPIPSTSSSQSSHHMISKGFDDVSSSTDDSNQERLCFNETAPDISSVKQEMNVTSENEEGERMRFADDNYENNFTLNDSTNVPPLGQEINVKTEEFSDVNSESNISIHEMNLKMEDRIGEELPSFMNGINDFENDFTSECMASGSQGMDVKRDKRQKTSSLGDHNYYENLLTSRNSINSLNDDCLLNIFNYLTIRDLIKIERVCKRWQKISLASWRKVKNLDIKTEFKTKTIQLDQVEGLLRRSGEYITSFDCSWLNKNTHLPANAAMAVINQYCKKLTHLDISYTWTKKNYLDSLNADLLKNLKSLTLGTNSFCDDHLPSLLEKAVNIEEFGMVGYNYNGPENKLLNLSEKCKTVAITNTKKFSNRMLQDLLEKHPNIENVDISATAITPSAFFPFTNRLKALALWHMENFFEVDLRDYELLKCPNLRILDLNMNDWGLTGEILKIIVENCPAIEDLRLRRAGCLTKDDFKHLKKLKKLTHLDVSYTKISGAHLLSLAEESNQLKKLFCYGCENINQAVLTKVITASPELSYLAILYCKLTKSFVKSVLASLQERKNKAWLTISLRSHSPDAVPDFVKGLDLKNRIDYHSKFNILRVVSGVSHCQCSFNKPCICIEDENTLLYFG